MNFEQIDLERSKVHLQSLIENGKLILGFEQLDKFISFLCFEINDKFYANNFQFHKDATTLKNNLFLTLKSLPFEKIQSLENSFIEDSEFDILLSKSFRLEKRKQLKQKLLRIEWEIADTAFDEIVAKAFQIEKREELKQKLKKLDIDSDFKEPKVIPLNSYFKYIGIAASFLLILLAWQPQHTSDKKLFAIYSNNINNSSIADYTGNEVVIEPDGSRGEEVIFKNYTNYESNQLLEAISLVKQNEFEKAKEIFNKHHIEKEKNPGLTLYLSIAQINTDNLDEGIKNLEYLTQLPSFAHKDEAKYHLAFAYLKLGDRKKAKELLHSLVNGKSKFSNQAQQTLKKIRWF